MSEVRMYWAVTGHGIEFPLVHPPAPKNLWYISYMFLVWPISHLKSLRQKGLWYRGYAFILLSVWRIPAFQAGMSIKTSLNMAECTTDTAKGEQNMQSFSWINDWMNWTWNPVLLTSGQESCFVIFIRLFSSLRNTPFGISLGLCSDYERHLWTVWLWTFAYREHWRECWQSPMVFYSMCCMFMLHVNRHDNCKSMFQCRNSIFICKFSHPLALLGFFFFTHLCTIDFSTVCPHFNVVTHVTHVTASVAWTHLITTQWAWLQWIPPRVTYLHALYGEQTGWHVTEMLRLHSMSICHYCVCTQSVIPSNPKRQCLNAPRRFFEPCK